MSSLKLVDTLDEQQQLESFIESTKPLVPPECRALHYLLSTPFRYGAVYPAGSRFRRAGLTEGVFYAGEKTETAVAEITFHRLLFFAESPDTPWPDNPAEYTAFSAQYRTRKSLDLTRGRFKTHSAAWLHPTDYSQCQALAELARIARIELIRYRSARDPRQGMNIALLTCRAFAQAEPLSFRTWRIYLRSTGAQAICEAPSAGISFDRQTFVADPRIAALRWER